MAHIFPHPLFWIAVIAAVGLTVAAGAIIDRFFTGRRRYARAAVRRNHQPR